VCPYRLLGLSPTLISEIEECIFDVAMADIKKSYSGTIQ
jgi:hypothetical protein